MTLLKKRIHLLVVLLMALSLVLAACGGDDDDDKGNDQAADERGADTITLSETYEGPYGITVHYPQGWIAAQQGTMVAVISSAAVLERMQAGEGMQLASDECLIGIYAGYPDDPEADLTATFNLLVEADYSEGNGISHTSAIEDITLGGQPAKRLNIAFAENDAEGILIAFFDGDVIVFGVILAGTGGINTFEATGLAIFDSVEYRTPAAE